MTESTVPAVATQPATPHSEIAPVQLTVTNIQFSDGTAIPFKAGNVVVIVGPNNSGKTETLNGIRSKINDPGDKNRVVAHVTYRRDGAHEAVSRWLESWTTRRATHYEVFGVSVHEHNVQHHWRDQGLGALTRFFCHQLTTVERLGICNPPPNIDFLRQAANHPIHFLYRDDSLEFKLSARFKRAFGVELIVHRGAGGTIPVYIGTRPTPGIDEDRVSAAYIRELETRPLLHEQGDGMRSFAGVMFTTSVGKESIQLIDEPEAFLHPPQARLLGRSLVQDRQEGRQLFVATHSNDVLRGILDAESADVRVIRIRRDGHVNAVRLLDNERIKELWADALLRSSNLLDGLFHEKVIVCESDSDCRFYSAILDSSLTGEEQRPDVMFTHCGGKHRLPMVIRSLKALDVPVVAVADFDLLSDETELSAVAEALGLPWTAVQADWRIVAESIRSKRAELNTNEVKAEIQAALSATTTPFFPADASKKITDALRRSSPWSIAKTVGKGYVPAGAPTNAYERLERRLRDAGLCIVQVGELENFDRTVSLHGPRWVNTVLEKNLSTPAFDEARGFVRSFA